MAIFLVHATLDSWMDGVNQSDNHGASSTVELGVVDIDDKSKFCRWIANFDVTPVAGRTINAAELRVRRSGSSNPSFNSDIERCTRPTTWTEGGVTWDKYDGVNSWTTGGGDIDATTPTPVDFNGLPLSGLNIITGMKGFVEDAISLRSNIVSFIASSVNEDPGVTQWCASQSREGTGHWVLAIDHSGPPIGIAKAVERRVMQGVMRGVQRRAG